MDLIDEISKTTPQLCKLNPASEVFITDLNEVGGIQSVLKELAKSRIGTYGYSNSQWYGW